MLLVACHVLYMFANVYMLHVVAPFVGDLRKFLHAIQRTWSNECVHVNRSALSKIVMDLNQDCVAVAHTIALSFNRKYEFSIETDKNFRNSKYFKKGRKCLKVDLQKIQIQIQTPCCQRTLTTVTYTIGFQRSVDP